MIMHQPTAFISLFHLLEIYPFYTFIYLVKQQLFAIFFKTLIKLQITQLLFLLQNLKKNLV